MRNVLQSRAVLLVLCPVGLVMGARWLISAPLDAADSTTLAPIAATTGHDDRLGPAADRWPTARLEGPSAKVRLVEALDDLVERLDALDGYEAIIWRQERIGGALRSEQTLRMKVRHRPASVYLEDIGVPQGCEIIHVEGRRQGRLVSHPGGGLVGWLLPAVELDPRSPLALAQSRFPITEAGLLPVARRLRRDARRDLRDPGASTVLDRVLDADGRTLFRSTQSYRAPNANRPFARVEVLFEPETFLIRSYRFFDWPDPSASPSADPPFGGCYLVRRFDEAAAPVDLDFEPTNPAYRFR